jgi:hypothetical protein
MKRITVTFTSSELSLLTSLASDQIFRREFIDPRLPGYKADPAELSLGKQLVTRLRVLTDRATKIRLAQNGAAR